VKKVSSTVVQVLVGIEGWLLLVRPPAFRKGGDMLRGPSRLFLWTGFVC